METNVSWDIKSKLLQNILFQVIGLGGQMQLLVGNFYKKICDIL